MLQRPRLFPSKIEDLLFLPTESNDPEQRFTKALYFFEMICAGLLEVFMAILAAWEGQLVSAVVHCGFAVVYPLLFNALRPRPQSTGLALGLLSLGFLSSTLSLLTNFSAGVLFWHLGLPIAGVLLLGPGWSVLVLAFDLLVATAHYFVFPGIFQRLQGWGLAATPGFFLSWEVFCVLLYGLFHLYQALTRGTVSFYKGQKTVVEDLLTNSRQNEEQFANQIRFLETLMDLIPFPIFYKGIDGKFLSCNASFGVIFDVPKDRVIGKKGEKFLVPHNAKIMAKIELDLLARDSMAVEEAVLEHADGTAHDFIVYLMPFADTSHSPQGFIGVLIDISERKRKEQKLVQLNATKDQLFSIISHDLRGPVGKVKQLLDVYVDDPGIFDKSTWDQVFHDMRKSTDSLFQLLENLLSWARSQRGEELVAIEVFALEPLVHEIFALQKLLAAEKNISLLMKIDLQGPLLSDKHVLATILRNLVNNALKFTRSGGSVTVSAQETSLDVCIAVVDTGIGMSPETIEKIFSRRERVTTYGTGKEKGQGIGLGLCIDLAQSLGASLEAESSLGTGTTIRLHLPTPEL